MTKQNKNEAMMAGKFVLKRQVAFLFIATELDVLDINEQRQLVFQRFLFEHQLSCILPLPRDVFHQQPIDK